MSILVDTVRIAGFRGVKNLEMTLPRVAVLIGPNNSGKTSFINGKQEGSGTHNLTTKQNQHLSSLRDWLLPMLMNGQVKVI